MVGGRNNKKTHEEYVAQLLVANPSVEVVGRYVDARTPVLIRCKECGNTWSGIPNNLLRGTRCPQYRSHKGFLDTRTYSADQFAAKLSDVNPDIELVGPYVNSRVKVKVRCKVCGHQWSALPSNLMHGLLCPNKKSHPGFIDSRTMDQKRYVERVQERNPFVRIDGEYTGANERILATCLICGHSWKPFAKQLTWGQGCPNCRKTGTSFMEQFVLCALRRILGDKEVLSRDRRTIGKELDIVIPKYSYAIEIGSWWWHRSKLNNDREKERACSVKGIRLLTVYDDFHAEENELDKLPKNYKGYDFVLARESGYATLKEIIAQVVSDCGVEQAIDEASWASIETEAMNKALPINTASFKEELAKINETIEVIGEYVGSLSPVKCRCKICHYEWNPLPSNLRAGRGCPSCAGVKRRTHEEFVSELAIKNPRVEVIGRFKSTKEKILVSCNQCGYEWAARPNDLRNGSGCPKCAGRLQTPDGFREIVAKQSPNLELLDEYKSAKTYMKVRCKKCGHICSIRASHLKEGSSCPSCGRKKTVVCVETGERFTGLEEAAKAVGLKSAGSISSACNHSEKTAGGFHWRYE